jgi:hypothetical protein
VFLAQPSNLPAYSDSFRCLLRFSLLLSLVHSLDLFPRSHNYATMKRMRIQTSHHTEQYINMAASRATIKALCLLGRPTAMLAVRAQAGTTAPSRVAALLGILALRALLVRAEAVVRKKPL